MITIDETIATLTADINEKRQSLDDGLFALQAWFDRNVELFNDDERTAFSDRLNAEKNAAKSDSTDSNTTTAAQGDDSSLISSVLRLHAMRLLYRFDERRRSIPALTTTSAYARAKQRLQVALREAELALNEARVDTAIANAHNILEDRGANRRWLQDALTRLQTLAHKDLVKLAEAVPAPDLPPLNPLQRAGFWLLGIKQEEIGRRTLLSLRKLAQLQTNQLTEMANLLLGSFEAIEDNLGIQQALRLLAQLNGA